MLRTKRNTLDMIWDMAECVQRYGPDIARIARETNSHKESVRYRYNRWLTEKSMKVEAIIDEAAFGLKPMGAKISMSRSQAQRAREVARLMSELCYLRGFEASLTDETYFFRWAVPLEHVAEFHAFVLELKSAGFLESVQFFEFDWFRRIPMAVRHYDFVEDHWNFDWGGVPNAEINREPENTKEFGFDLIDLLLGVELQADSGRSMAEIGTAIEWKYHLPVNYKTLQYHYHSHLVRNKLVQNYIINWHGAALQHQAPASPHPMERFVLATLLARKLLESEREAIMTYVSRTPFLWAEAGGRDYLARLAFPAEYAPKSLEYMRDSLRLLNGKGEYHLVSQRNSEVFPLPHQLWDASKREWRFDRKTLMNEFRRELAEQ